MNQQKNQNQTEVEAWKKKLPMWLTWGRMAVAPVLVVLLSFRELSWTGYLASAFFIAASITDWFDGSLARKYNAITNMGKFMDPIADKVLVSSALIMLLPSQEVHPVMVLILLLRDILIGGIRAVAAADGLVLDAKNAGKWKTGLQMVAIPMLLLKWPELYHLGNSLMWVSAVLSLYSGYQYMAAYFEVKKEKD